MTRVGGVAALMALLAGWTTTEAHAGSEAVRVYGYFDTVLGFNRYESDSVGWDAYHLDILGSWLVSSRFRVVSDVTFEHGTQHTGTNLGDLKVRGYLETMLGDALRINVGKFLLPFGEQNLYHDATPAYLSVQSPRSVYWRRSIGLDPAGGVVRDRFFQKDGAGLWAWGVVVGGDWEWEYHAYVTNGRGVGNTYQIDDNRSPGVGGRMTLATPGGLTFGGSVYWDQHGKLQGDPAFTVLVGAGQLSWRYDRFQIRSEVMVPRTDNGEQVFTGLGMYAEGAVSFGPLTPYGRFEDFRYDFQDQHEQIVVGGFNYNFPGTSVFFKAEHNQYLVREPAVASPIDTDENVPDFVVQGQIAVAF